MNKVRAGRLATANLIAALVLTCGAATGRASTAAVPPGLTKHPWIEVTGDHLVCYSDGDRKSVVTMVRNLERLRDVIGRTTQGLEPAPDLPTIVLAFKDDAVFAAYAGDLQHGGRRVAGYFEQGEGASYLVINLASHEEPLRVAHHEFIHLVLAGSVPTVPLWFNEGLAEYYSTFQVGTRDATIGKPIEYHVAALNGRQPFTLPRLLGINEVSPEYHEPRDMQIFYAEAWQLVHMLMTGTDADRKAVGAFLTALRGGAKAERAFPDALAPATLDELGARLTAYIDGRSYAYTTWTYANAFDDVKSDVRDITPAEVQFQLGDYLRRSENNRMEEARVHLVAALAADPAHTAARAALGRIADAGEDTVRADQAYRSALAAPNADRRTRLLVAEGWVERAQRSGRGDAAIPADHALPEALAARAVLEPMLDAAPGDLAALALYGQTFVGSREDLVLGIDALTTVATAWPRRSDIAFDLVCLYAASGATQVARRVADERLAPTAARGELANAWTAIINCARRETRANCEKGRYAAAESLLTDLGRGCPDADGRSALLALSVDTRMREAEAMAMTPGKGRDEARKQLEALLTEPIDESQKMSIRGILNHLK